MFLAANHGAYLYSTCIYFVVLSRLHRLCKVIMVILSLELLSSDNP